MDNPYLHFSGILLSLFVLLMGCQKQTEGPEPGVSRDLAEQRFQLLTNISYHISLNIPSSLNQPIRGQTEIKFRSDTLSPDVPLILDFEEAKNRLDSLSLDHKPVHYETTNGHIVIPGSELKAGSHTLNLTYRAGDESLNRNKEYLYTLFVPDRASHALPLFDQPDLKAHFSLNLTVPPAWKAVANGPLLEKKELGHQTRYQFAETAPLPTYLFAFAAGKFKVETAERNGRVMHMYHRETDREKVDRNKKAIFDLHAKALKWLEDYTGIKYPFNKFDFVLIPSFQYGGMEHPGAILYRASSLMLDKSATKNDYLNRASVISHETSHMWFGDLVTMKWFNDVWTKEVFANFMAAKIVYPSFPDIDHEQRFLLDHYPPAYAIDRSRGPNAIRQQLRNLKDAGNLYGSIIYHKAPIVMRKLEDMLGKNKMQRGLQTYLKTYQYGNATWPDLIHILDQYTVQDLNHWSTMWVDEAGRPEINVTLPSDDGQVNAVQLAQEDPAHKNRIWPQQLHVLISKNGETDLETVPLDKNQISVSIPARFQNPDFVIPNGTGRGYGYFKLDAISQDYLLDHLPEINNAKLRADIWITLWDALLYDRLPVPRFMDLAEKALKKEDNELNIQQILSYTEQAYWRYSTPEARKQHAPELEQLTWNLMEKAGSTSLKSTYFSAYRSVAMTDSTLARLKKVWNKTLTIKDLPLSVRDYNSLAATLALHEVPGWKKILDEQTHRIDNPDIKKRFEFIQPALSANQHTRDQFFESLKDPKNRRHEPWVIMALNYLHHPLRAKASQKYIYPSLQLLKEIQRTGDIFFPKSWLDATFSGHNSDQAALAIKSFLDVRSNYPRFLRAKILQAADPVFRSVNILEHKQYTLK